MRVSKSRRKLGQVALAAITALATIAGTMALSTTAATADDRWDRGHYEHGDRDHRDHGRWERERWERERWHRAHDDRWRGYGPYWGTGYYVAPPPPRYYYPPAAYYAEPGVSLGFTFR